MKLWVLHANMNSKTAGINNNIYKQEEGIISDLKWSNLIKCVDLFSISSESH